MSREELVEKVCKVQEELAEDARPEGLMEKDGLLVKGLVFLFQIQHEQKY